LTWLIDGSSVCMAVTLRQIRMTGAGRLLISVCRRSPEKAAHFDTSESRPSSPIEMFAAVNKA
jgi:hypothetical protein